MKMKRGELVGFNNCTGYRYDHKTKTLSINEEEAETVRYIFDRYCAGVGCTVIAHELNAKGLLTIKSRPWQESTVRGIIKNEKYKGDCCLGKSITLDPISKRRVDNRGEEEMYYVRDHHEPIVSAEIFEKAQEIMNKRYSRATPVEPFKRQRLTRQFSFSCMMKCGFCDSTYTRRTWHSSTTHNKTIWQCMANSKKGKKYCPDSKGISEDVIEKAFLESYRLLTSSNRDVADEFMKRMRKALDAKSIEDRVKELSQKEYNIKRRRKRLLDRFLNDYIDKDLYEETDQQLKKELQEVDEQKAAMADSQEQESQLRKRFEMFDKLVHQNVIMQEFDREVFESIVEKVIIGGYDEDGNKDPYKITFVYKTGVTDDVTGAKDKYETKKKPGRKKGSSSKNVNLSCDLKSRGENRINACSQSVEQQVIAYPDTGRDACGMRDAVAEEQPKIQSRYSCKD